MEGNTYPWWVLCLLFFIGFFLNSHVSSGTDTISGNQSLSGDQTIVSSGGVFELGFFKPGHSPKYYIGIWYKKVSKKTIVWVANREKPVRNANSSVLRISDGNLVLFNEFQLPIRSTNISVAGSSSIKAVLGDDGNLVLRNRPNSTSNLWESFNFPADTWLPGMKFGFMFEPYQSQLLTSWKNSEDPASGLFSLEFDDILWNKSVQYSTTGLWDRNISSLDPDMRLNYLCNFSHVSNENERQVKQLSWLESSKQWNVLWSQHRQQCKVYAFCGAFGSCNEKALPFCNCLQGFDPKWNCATMASPYFDDFQKLFITSPQVSSYVNPLYDEKATAGSESFKSLAERIVDFAEESNRLHEERIRRLEENLKHVVQSQQRHAASEATSTSMPPSHSKSTKTNTSNSPLTPRRHKPTQVQTCQPSINEALLKKCSRRLCFLNGRSPSKFNYGQWLKVKYPFKVVSLKRGVISNLGGQPSQIEQQRLQDLIANEAHKAIEKEVARFVPLQPDANSSIQSMPPQQKHVCKLSPPQHHKDNIGGGIRNTMPSHLPSGRRKMKSKDLYWTPMKEQEQQTHVSEWRHGGHDLVEKHGGMCKCYLYKQSQFRHCRHINLVACPEFLTQNPRTLRRRLQKKRAKEHRRHVAEVHASQRQQPPRKQRFIWVEKKKHNAASQEANQNLVNAIVSPKTFAKHVPFKSNDSKATKELNASSKTISLGEFIIELPSSIPNLPFVFTRKQDAASSSKDTTKNKANMSTKENKGRDHKKDAATFVPRGGMLPSVKSMSPKRHSANNMKSLQMHKALDEGTYWLRNLDGSLHLTKINSLPFQPCCPSVCREMALLLRHYAFYGGVLDLCLHPSSTLGSSEGHRESPFLTLSKVSGTPSQSYLPRSQKGRFWRQHLVILVRSFLGDFVSFSQQKHCFVVCKDNKTCYNYPFIAIETCYNYPCTAITASLTRKKFM
ncbi:hypothetical protein SLEP1_g31424 [Rubroshorea leprosula]|uniref:Bulb-type lectin domain-containing protein n=1 Tax=Rubroshorea leprosula TaxID=152421 RepID=A0AAV5K3B9_9ROSI|nr:hypothetical protein SLEP1_g31424 [Rubroshorea leprosula]